MSMRHNLRCWITGFPIRCWLDFMDFELSPRQKSFRDRVRAFMDEEVRPVRLAYRKEIDAARWEPSPTVETLKRKAQAAGLWNLFMPPAGDEPSVDISFEFGGERLTNLEYASCAEEMGHVDWASEVFNCAAPDTGNMEVLHRYGSFPQKERWLEPLMTGRLRSAFLMTEPDVASSDATNIQTTIQRDGDSYRVDGRKWWSTGGADPRCKMAIVMGKTDPSAERHQQQSMIIVDLESPGVKVERLLPVFGYDHAPHGHVEISLTDVWVPRENLLLGEGRGFEIAQGRLGPGRVHHCMRLIGMAEEALACMANRLVSRIAFGKHIGDHSIWEERIARARVGIEMTRLLCLKAAERMDRHGNKAALDLIAMIKLQAPRMVLRVIDDAIQAHGGAGVSDDYPLAEFWADARALRIADGPDEVHARTIARLELGPYREQKA